MRWVLWPLAGSVAAWPTVQPLWDGILAADGAPASPAALERTCRAINTAAVADSAAGAVLGGAHRPGEGPAASRVSGAEGERHGEAACCG
jgi:hypothetical protein